MLKVSVVVPVYNPGDYFTPCIDSLISQSLPSDEFEIICVDDGSTDKPLPVPTSSQPPTQT